MTGDSAAEFTAQAVTLGWGQWSPDSIKSPYIDASHQCHNHAANFAMDCDTHFRFSSPN